ncbi:MAG: glycosyltransferase, partial [Aggregatilineaceae bacterium]
MSLRLGFHYHIPMTRDTDGRLRTPGYQGRFLDSLARHCEQLVCFLHSPSPTDTSPLDYTIESRNVIWVDIGPHASVPRRMVGARKVMRIIAPWRSQLDAMLIRGPSPLLPVVAGAVKDLPTSLLLVGDYLAGIDDLPQPRWRKEAIRLWARWNHHQQMRVARRSLTFVNSRKLYNELRPFVRDLVETRTTTLTAADFYEREDTCTQRPIRLLYTGRMDRAKGLLHMVEALALLVQRGEDVVLDLVGWPQKGDPILDEVQVLAQQKGIADRVFYHGYKPVGPELFAYYKQADIYVIASTSSFEGFPRTIWEAMAHGLPVV